MAHGSGLTTLGFSGRVAWSRAAAPSSSQHGDAAATSVAIEDPGHVGIVAAILGHSTARTGETYYNQASSLEATRRHQAVVKHLRTQSIGKA